MAREECDYQKTKEDIASHRLMKKDLETMGKDWSDKTIVLTREMAKRRKRKRERHPFRFSGNVYGVCQCVFGRSGNVIYKEEE